MVVKKSARLALAGLAAMGLNACSSSKCGFDPVENGFISTQTGDNADYYWACHYSEFDSGFNAFWLADGTGDSGSLGTLTWSEGDKCASIDISTSVESMGDFTIANIEVSGDGDTAAFDAIGAFDFDAYGTFTKLTVSCDKTSI